MQKTTTFEYQNRTITARRQTNAVREQIRQLTRRLAKLRGDLSASTADEFAGSVILVVSGDDHVWHRPSPTCDDETLLAALNYWLEEVDASFVDQLWLAAVYQNVPDPVTVTKPPPPEAKQDPNS